MNRTRFHGPFLARTGCRVFAGALFVLILLVLAQPRAMGQESVDFEYLYDDNNQLVRVIDSLGNVVTYNYDAGGNLVSVSQTTVDQLGPPEIANVTPGSVNAGETLPVFIEGSNFFLGQLTVGDPRIELLSGYLNDTQALALLAVPLDAPVGPLTLTVTTALGSDSTTVNVIGPLPKVTQMTPARGTALGGTTVNLFGTQLTADTSVFFGGVPAGSTRFIDSTRMEVETPPGPPGQLVAVEVANPNGATLLFGGFQYAFPFSIPGAHPVSINTTRPLVLTLGEPSATDVTVFVSVDNPGIATAPESVVIPAERISVQIPVTGAGIGTTRLGATINSLRLEAAIFVGGVVAGEYDIALASLGGLIPGRSLATPVGSEVAPNLLPTATMAVDTMRTITLVTDEPAPEEGLIITLLSSDEQIAMTPAEAFLPGGERAFSFEVNALNRGASFLRVRAGDQEFRLHLLVNTSVERTGIIRSPILGVMAPSGADIGAQPVGALVAPREPTFAPIVGVEIEE